MCPPSEGRPSVARNRFRQRNESGETAYARIQITRTPADRSLPKSSVKSADFEIVRFLSYGASYLFEMERSFATMAATPRGAAAKEQSKALRTTTKATGARVLFRTENVSRERRPGTGAVHGKSVAGP
jgi:hypothetical protein